jgi:amino acid adenylation domain-containing protein
MTPMSSIRGGHDGPASFQQSALWRAHQLAPHPGAFNLLWVLKLRGPLDPAALRRALAEVTRRHDALRATFVTTPDGLRQRIAPAGEVACPLVEMPAPGASGLEQTARRLGHVPYDLAGGPLYRFELLRFSPGEHALLCAFHHLVIDGSSWPIFVEDLVRGLSGEAIPPLERQYADFTEWQRQRLDSGAWARERAYWQSVYRTAKPSWELPADSARPALPDNAGAVLSLPLPAATGELLRAVAARSGSTPFRTAFAAFFALLHRVTGNDELLVTTTLIGRSDRRFADLVGFFVNTAGIRAGIPDGTRFEDLVRQVGAQVDAAVRHEDYPFDLAVQDAAPRHEMNRDAFSPVGFTKMPTTRVRQAAGLELEDERVFLDDAHHDLSVYFHDDRGTCRLTFVHRTAVLARSAVERVAGQFLQLLAHALERPETPVLDLECVPSGERRQLLSDWNASGRMVFPERSVHAMVEAQARRTPDRIALVSAETQLTYRQVNAAANRIAAQLRSRGVGPGCFVPVVIDASPECPIAELAVMKAGAAFTPLDPGWPQPRLDALLDKLGSRVVLVRCAAHARLAGRDREAVIVKGAGDVGDEPNPGVDVGPDDPIYCMFTSGSTGLPKGAINRHRGIVNRLAAMTVMFGAPSEDSVLAVTAPVADSSVWQYFWPLTSGGRCAIFPTEHVVDPARLVELLGRHGITFTDFVPSVFQLLVEHLRARPEARPGLGRLRRILIGGETMKAGDVYAFKAMLPQVALTNCYGPTETSIGVIFHEVPPDYTDPMPIGRPLPNVRAVILDRRLNLAPIGASGELCLGGECVGLGYLADPESTARAFVPNPFPELECPTLYRTGDLARIRGDGVIEHRGRIDNQVKIRGMRIEPEEIEAVLARHPQVRQAAVLAREDASGEKRLVAYVAPVRPDAPLDAFALRGFLRRSLPEHLIPAAFIALDALPLSPGGKVDRKAVGRTAGVALQADTPYAAPRNDPERLIVSVLQEVLHRERVGIRDHFFFDLGGDSLLAIIFAARLGERSGRPVEVRSVYEWPTPAGLAVHLAPAARDDDAGRVGRAAATGAAPEEPGGQSLEQILARQRPLVSTWQGARPSADSFLFTHNPAGRNRGLFWCLQGYRELAQLSAHLGADQPVHGMRSGHLIMAYTDHAVDTLAAHYASEMAVAQPEGAFIVGGNCQGALIARAIALRLMRMGRAVDLLVLMEESSFREYDGRVALLFGRESHLNPYKPGADPEAVFRRSYPAGFTVDFIAGGHGEFFNAPNVARLAHVLKIRLAARAILPSPPSQE